jgi:phage antirepressor YoqD-like protein
MLLVNEPGLYALIGKSRKEEAKAFRRWINHEVLPSIRKHGAYATDEVLDNMLADPANASKVFQALAEEREKLRLAEAKVIQLNDENNDLSRENLDMQPKAALADKVTDNMTKFRLGVVAKEAGVNQAFIRGVLVAEGLMSWDYRDSGNGRIYYATEKAHDDGLCVFAYKKSKYKRTTRWNYFFTQKGLDYIVNHPAIVDERESMQKAA